VICFDFLLCFCVVYLDIWAFVCGVRAFRVCMCVRVVCGVFVS